MHHSVLHVGIVKKKIGGNSNQCFTSYTPVARIKGLVPVSTYCSALPYPTRLKASLESQCGKPATWQNGICSFFFSPRLAHIYNSSSNYDGSDTTKQESCMSNAFVSKMEPAWHKFSYNPTLCHILNIFKLHVQY